MFAPKLCALAVAIIAAVITVRTGEDSFQNDRPTGE